MSNEQKLLHVALEAINALMMGAERYSDNHWGRICMPTDSAMSKGADAAMAIRQALATTEPEPTGMPELHPVAHIELGDDSHDVVTLEAAKAYGEQCWKAGYKHGAWGDKPDPTSKQSLQVEPAVNQQLTTEPVDEREAFEKVFPTPAHCQRCGDGYAATSYNAWEAHNHIERWKGWQARAAMAKGVNG